MDSVWFLRKTKFYFCNNLIFFKIHCNSTKRFLALSEVQPPFSCSASYIGETGQILEERIKDHTTNQNSVIRKQHLNTGHPLPKTDDKDIKILGTDSNTFRGQVKEAIFIKTNNPELNQNIGKFDLPPIYDQLLTGGGHEKLVIKTKVKEAIPKLKLKAINASQYQIIRE